MGGLEEDPSSFLPGQFTQTDLCGPFRIGGVQRVKPTCVALSANCYLVGTNTGSVSVFARTTKKFVKFINPPEATGATISCVDISPDEVFVAFATVSGRVFVFEAFVTSGEKAHVVASIDQHDGLQVTAMAWDQSALPGKLYTGDSEGTVLVTDVGSPATGSSFFSRRRKKDKLGIISEKMYGCDAPIVQLVQQGNALLISSRMKSIVWDLIKNEDHVIGTKNPNREGPYGGCFHPQHPHRVCAARPKGRTWLANLQGGVEVTLKVQKSSELSAIALGSTKPQSHPAFTFGKLLPLGGGLVSHDETSLSIFDLGSIEVRKWFVDVEGVFGVSSYGLEFVVLHGADRRITHFSPDTPASSRFWFRGCVDRRLWRCAAQTVCLAFVHHCLTSHADEHLDEPAGHGQECSVTSVEMRTLRNELEALGDHALAEVVRQVQLRLFVSKQPEESTPKARPSEHPPTPAHPPHSPDGRANTSEGAFTGHPTASPLTNATAADTAQKHPGVMKPLTLQSSAASDKVSPSAASEPQIVTGSLTSEASDALSAPPPHQAGPQRATDVAGPPQQTSQPESHSQSQTSPSAQPHTVQGSVALTTPPESDQDGLVPVPAPSNQTRHSRRKRSTIRAIAPGVSRKVEFIPISAELELTPSPSPSPRLASASALASEASAIWAAALREEYASDGATRLGHNVPADKASSAMLDGILEEPTPVKKPTPSAKGEDALSAGEEGVCKEVEKALSIPDGEAALRILGSNRELTARVLPTFLPRLLRLLPRLTVEFCVGLYPAVQPEVLEPHLRPKDPTRFFGYLESLMAVYPSRRKNASAVAHLVRAALEMRDNELFSRILHEVTSGPFSYDWDQLHHLCTVHKKNDQLLRLYEVAYRWEDACRLAITEDSLSYLAKALSFPPPSGWLSSEAMHQEKLRRWEVALKIVCNVWDPETMNGADAESTADGPGAGVEAEGGRGRDDGEVAGGAAEAADNAGIDISKILAEGDGSFPDLESAGLTPADQSVSALLPAKTAQVSRLAIVRGMARACGVDGALGIVESNLPLLSDIISDVFFSFVQEEELALEKRAVEARILSEVNIYCSSTNKLETCAPQVECIYQWESRRADREMAGSDTHTHTHPHTHTLTHHGGAGDGVPFSLTHPRRPAGSYGKRPAMEPLEGRWEAGAGGMSIGEQLVLLLEARAGGGVDTSRLCHVFPEEADRNWGLSADEGVSSCLECSHPLFSYGDSGSTGGSESTVNLHAGLGARCGEQLRLRLFICGHAFHASCCGGDVCPLCCAAGVARHVPPQLTHAPQETMSLRAVDRSDPLGHSGHPPPR
eukprot:Rmarinus@m.9327